MYQKSKGLDTDSSYVDGETLKPIAYRTDIATSKYKEHKAFLETQIKSRVIYPDSVSTSIFENKHKYNGVIINDLISALPLEMGKVFKIDLVNPGIRFREYTVSIEVLGKEKLNLGVNKDVNCWKLKVNYGMANSFNEEWFTVGGQVQIRSELKMKNGSRFIRTIIL